MATKLEMINKLLNTFGEYYDPSPSWINGEGEVYNKLVNYGLRILQGRKWGNITVFFEEDKVFDLQGNICKKGVWEEILEEYYNKIPVILKNIEENKIRQNRGNDMIKKVDSLIPCNNRGYSEESTDTLELSAQTTLTRLKHKNTYGYKETITKVLSSQNPVFIFREYEQSGSHDWYDTVTTTDIYIPGEWEEEVRRAYNEKVQTRSLANTYLERLRNMQ